MMHAVIVGGGVIGLSVAWELAGQCASVSVFDQGPIGKEASWAGAGILPPGNREYAKTADAHLRSLSHSLWPKFSETLLSETGIDNGFRTCGGAEMLLPGENPLRLEHEVQFWESEGVQVRALNADELREAEPQVNPEAVGGYLLPQLAQVRNPRHLKALHAACLQRGVQFHPHHAVYEFLTEGEQVRGVRTPAGIQRADQVCITAGAWSRDLLTSLRLTFPFRPVRGQIVQLIAQHLPFRRVLQVGPRYLVPRPDGRILIGATEEDVGFDKRNTASGVAGLLEFAVSVVPSLQDAKFEQAWAGLRPGSPEGVPFMGLVPGYSNLFVAAGHFRSGLQMSPGTGVHMRQLMLEQPTVIPADLYQYSE